MNWAKQILGKLTFFLIREKPESSLNHLLLFLLKLFSKNSEIDNILKHHIIQNSKVSRILKYSTLFCFSKSKRAFVFKNVIKVDGRKMIFPCKNPVFISWNKLKFSPCKNSVLDPWSNRRQHVNYHGIMTGHSCEINQIILCSSRVQNRNHLCLSENFTSHSHIHWTMF